MHREATYSEAVHREATYSEAVHREATYSEAVHREATYSEAVHSEATYSKAVHREATYSEAVHSEAVFQRLREKLTINLARKFGLSYPNFGITGFEFKIGIYDLNHEYRDWNPVPAKHVPRTRTTYLKIPTHAR